MMGIEKWGTWASRRDSIFCDLLFMRLKCCKREIFFNKLNMSKDKIVYLKVDQSIWLHYVQWSIKIINIMDFGSNLLKEYGHKQR